MDILSLTTTKLSLPGIAKQVKKKQTEQKPRGIESPDTSSNHIPKQLNILSQLSSPGPLMCQTNAQTLPNIQQEPNLITLRLIRLTPIILSLHRPVNREVLRHGRNEETRR